MLVRAHPHWSPDFHKVCRSCHIFFQLLFLNFAKPINHSVSVLFIPPGTEWQIRSWVFYVDSTPINRQEFQRGMPGVASNAKHNSYYPSTVTLLPFMCYLSKPWNLTNGVFLKGVQAWSNKRTCSFTSVLGRHLYHFSSLIQHSKADRWLNPRYLVN